MSCRRRNPFRRSKAPSRAALRWRSPTPSSWWALARSACAWRWRSRSRMLLSSCRGDVGRQFPRSGAARRLHHPTTLEFFDRIGLYAKMEPRGLIAPKFQYWDRQDNALIAEFDHALLKDDTRFPYVLQCERIKIIEEALKMAKAHPLIAVRMATELFRSSRRPTRIRAGENACRRRRNIKGSTSSAPRRAQHRAEGSRRRIRRLHLSGAHINIEVAYDFRKHGYTERNYISDPDEYSTVSTGRARRTAGASTFRPRSRTTRTS